MPAFATSTGRPPATGSSVTRSSKAWGRTRPRREHGPQRGDRARREPAQRGRAVAAVRAAPRAAPPAPRALPPLTLDRVGLEHLAHVALAHLVGLAQHPDLPHVHAVVAVHGVGEAAADVARLL